MLRRSVALLVVYVMVVFCVLALTNLGFGLFYRLVFSVVGSVM